MEMLVRLHVQGLKLCISVLILFISFGKLNGCIDGSSEKEWIFTQLVSNTDETLTDIQFVGDIGFAVGDEGTILKTTDGVVWQQKESGVTVGLTSIFFVNAQVGFVSGFKATILRTLNGGESFELLAFPETEGGLYGLYFVDEHNGFVVSGRGKIYMTTDAGVSWNLICENQTHFYTAVNFIDDENGFVVGGAGDATSGTSAMLKTTNAGTDWQPINAGLKETINDIDFGSSERGLFVAYDNNIFRSQDGGLNWERVAGTNGGNWRGVVFAGSQLAFAAGESGAIIVSENGGMDWRQTVTNSHSHLQRIRTNSRSSKVYAVGANGTILVHIL